MLPALNLKKGELVISLVVAILGIVAYWHFVKVDANPTVINDYQLKRKLSEASASNSNEETSREEDLAEGSSPYFVDHSAESREEQIFDNGAAEVRTFSGRIVSAELDKGKISVANVQEWVKTVPLVNTADNSDTVMYFLDEHGEDGGLKTLNITDLKIVAGNLPCNNGAKNQFFRESDRCNGIYQCDDNGEDERSCPNKCHGFRYPYAIDLVDCKAYIPRYFYDYETQSCEFFVYGGCADVINNFLSKNECERECFGFTSTTTTTTTTTTMMEPELTSTATTPIEIILTTSTPLMVSEDTTPTEEIVTSPVPTLVNIETTPIEATPSATHLTPEETVMTMMTTISPVEITLMATTPFEAIAVKKRIGLLEDVPTLHEVTEESSSSASLRQLEGIPTFDQITEEFIRPIDNMFDEGSATRRLQEEMTESATDEATPVVAPAGSKLFGEAVAVLQTVLPVDDENLLTFPPATNFDFETTTLLLPTASGDADDDGEKKLSIAAAPVGA